MEKVMNMVFASSLSDWKNINSSFDSGVLRIAYPGTNRNKSNISKEAFEKAIPTMFNCPIVCNYDRDTDTIGGHDMELVRRADGSLSLVESTVPCGVIPESADYWWDTVTEEDGTEHEYLFVEALLWKRQEVYRKIKQDGITAQSMEIKVRKGKSKDGVYYIDDFCFTAFTLLGGTPCFENAALEMYSKEEFKLQFFEMMQELKESFGLVNTSSEADNIQTNSDSMKGGEGVLKMEKNTSTDETIVNGNDAKKFSDESGDTEVQEETGVANKTDDSVKDSYSLNRTIVEEIRKALENEICTTEYGDYPRYVFEDFDAEAGKVYGWDRSDWLLYGFDYTMNGDSALVDFESKKRMKYVIEEFNEGDVQESPFAETFSKLNSEIKNLSEFKEKYEETNAAFSEMKTEFEQLRQFKEDTEYAIKEKEHDSIFEMFADLDGIEAYEALKADSMKYDRDVLEEKCFAIRGRNTSIAKFSLEPKAPKLKVERETETIMKEPYGGLFEKYGNKN